MKGNVSVETLYNLIGETAYLETRIDLLTKGVQMTPITKGLFGYKCNQDILERDANLLENLEGIRESVKKLVEIRNQLFEELNREES